MNVTSLGYVGVQASDLPAWETYATAFLGLMPTASDDGLRLFRMDSRAWRFAIEAGPVDGIAFAGFEVSGPDALEALIGRLQALSYHVERGDPSLAKSRQVRGLAIAHDPGGLRVELFYGATERFDVPFRSGVTAGFHAGGQGLGHIVLMSPDPAASLKFYCEGLGFELSDTIGFEIGPNRSVELTFLHCNPRHHSLAIGPSPGPQRLHHFMVQVDTLDEVGFALDRAAAQSVPLTMTLGRHTNDHMVSFYARTPSGFDVEFGWGAREVDSGWSVGHHDRTSSWGHRPLPAPTPSPQSIEAPNV
jgi:biphenyl-2,3-diol 1,2-dioxygenase